MPTHETEGAGRGLSVAEREALGMAVSTGCGCWPDGACHDCAFVHRHLVPAVEQIVAEHYATGRRDGAVEAERERDGHRKAATQWAKAAKEDHASAERAEAERDHWRKRAERRLATMDQLKAENDRLRAQVAACEALAEEWERLAADAAWAAGYRAAWGSSAGQVRAALSDPAAVLAQVRAEAWNRGVQTAREHGWLKALAMNPYRNRGGDDGRA